MALSGTDVVQQFFPTSALPKGLGIELRELPPDEAVLAMPYREGNTTTGTVVHGGAVAALIDTAAMAAAWSGVEAPTVLRGSTVGLTVAYLAPADATGLLARARVLRRGRSLVYVDVEVVDDGDRPVARGLVTYKLG